MLMDWKEKKTKEILDKESKKKKKKKNWTLIIVQRDSQKCELFIGYNKTSSRYKSGQCKETQDVVEI